MYRTSQALVLIPDRNDTIGYNFIKKSSFSCTETILSLLHRLANWHSLRQICDEFPSFSQNDLASCLNDLVKFGGIVKKDSAEQVDEDQKIGSWEWGIPSALLHFSEQDRSFMSIEQAELAQSAAAKISAPPSLYLEHANDSNAIDLVNTLATNELLSLMARRRTVREVLPSTLSQQALADCLFAGLGITGETENCVGKLPLKMTPSGGARNPYEAYVLVNSVDSMEAGAFHYSAKQHNLARIGDVNESSASVLLGNQDWADNMSCTIFLCAHFERTMWKYKDNNAYRVVLIEAGHIAQNIMIAATSHNLTACPTAALAHGKIAKLFKLNNQNISPIYALTIGKPS